jgi:sugar phosphate isomerase/epimerase
VKIGLFLALFHDRPLGDALVAARNAGCQAVEVSTTGPHAHEDIPTQVAAYGLELSALSCHGNPLHPNAAIAEKADQDFRETVRLATEAGIHTVVTFSGCPGESEHSLRPSWVTCSWPDDFLETLDWQWNERVLPYWAEAADFAREHGIRVAIEPHPGQAVYNTDTMLRLRAAAGESIGVNFDPSHLFWQQIDPIASAKALGSAIFHVHAKDTGFNPDRLRLNGVLETHVNTDERSWIFRSVGDGHPVEFWRELVVALQESGYDHVLSIEHEDPLRPPDEGVRRAVGTLNAAITG